MMDTYTGDVPQPPPAFPRVSFETFHNSCGDFDDTNNISLVTVLTAGDTTFLIPGDLEKPGWGKLLERPNFRSALAGVDVYIASHHGRESGFCKEVFDYATDVFVFSDSPVSYATQEMSSLYGNYANGVMFNGTLRKVLTTRNDSSLIWTL